MSSLLSKIAQGDAKAVDACLDRYGDLVWRLARRYLDRADGEVEDAVQEVFVELWLAAERFDPAKGSEAAFVATLAHRRLIDYQRRVSARRRMHVRVSQEAPTTLGNRGSSVHGNSHPDGPSHEQAAAASTAFEMLPSEERRALHMAVFLGMTQQQISEATQAPIGTVKSRLRRGMLRLGEFMGKVPETSTKHDPQSIKGQEVDL